MRFDTIRLRSAGHVCVVHPANGAIDGNVRFADVAADSQRRRDRSRRDITTGMLLEEARGKSPWLPAKPESERWL